MNPWLQSLIGIEYMDNDGFMVDCFFWYPLSYCKWHTMWNHLQNEEFVHFKMLLLNKHLVQV